MTAAKENSPLYRPGMISYKYIEAKWSEASVLMRCNTAYRRKEPQVDRDVTVTWCGWRRDSVRYARRGTVYGTSRTGISLGVGL